jgi:hypothetical protein
MSGLSLRVVLGICGAAVLGAAVFGFFATTSSAGSANASIQVFIGPSTISQGERGLVTAKFKNPAPGTINHVVIKITLDKPIGELGGSLGLQSGCSSASADGATVVTCDLGQVPASDATLFRYITFTAGSATGSTIGVSATATFDEAGAGGGKKAVKSLLSDPPVGEPLYTVTVAAADPDLKGGCIGATRTLATAIGGSTKLDTSVTMQSTPSGPCAPVLIEETSLAPGATCDGNPCQTAGSFVTFAGLARVEITFSFPPPGALPMTFSVYQFRDTSSTTGTPVPSCLTAAPTCVESITRYPSLRQIKAVLQVSAAGVDPGFAG